MVGRVRRDQHPVLAVRQVVVTVDVTDDPRRPFEDRRAETVAGNEIVNVMTPDKILDLVIEMAEESVQIATEAQKYVSAQSKEELGRFITDSQALVYITKAWRHKVLAAVEKRKFQLTEKEQHKESCLKHLEDALFH